MSGKVKSWENAKINKAVKLWAEGISVHFMAQSLGVSKDAVIGLCYRRRDLFPARRAVEPVKKNSPTPEPIVVERILPPDRVKRVTISGASVTMPRITFIDGPAAAAEAIMEASI